MRQAGRREAAGQRLVRSASQFVLAEAGQKFRVTPLFGLGLLLTDVEGGEHATEAEAPQDTGVSVATVRKTGISPALANHNAFDEALEKLRRPEFRDNTAK